MNADAAAAAEEDGRAIGRKPRPVGGQEQIGLEFVAQGFADLAQIRRADLLAGLDDEFGIEAEPAAARLAHRAQRRQVDAVLALVVGGAAAVDAVAVVVVRHGSRLSRHSPAMPSTTSPWPYISTVGTEGILAIVRQKVRAPAGRRFDQPRREIELRKGRLQVLPRDRRAALAPLGILAFGLIGDPAVEFGEKRAGMKLLARPGNGVGSGHVFLSRSRNASRPPTYRDTTPAGSGHGSRQFALLKPAGMQQFRPIARRSIGR